MKKSWHRAVLTNQKSGDRWNLSTLYLVAKNFGFLPDTFQNSVKFYKV